MQRWTRRIAAAAGAAMLVVAAGITAGGAAGARADAAGDAGRDAVVLTVRASPTAEYATREELPARGLRRALADAAQRAPAEPAPPAHVRAELLDTFVASPAANVSYGVDDDGTVVDAARGVRLRTPERWRRELSAARERLRARHYGALLPWSEASAALPRMAAFDVVDVETGLAFRAQRRAGSAHADVQPLTRHDAATMKRIYGGRWSWDRRAVLLRYGDRQFAASMNGMPHGGDGIPGNGFNGHFCIHFAGSTTHGKANLDLAHQTMAHKAAGQLSPFLAALSPYQVADLFVIAYNQRDKQLLSAAAADGDGEALLADGFRERHVKLLRRDQPLPEQQPGSDQTSTELTYAMDVTAYIDGSAKGQRRTLTFRLVRHTFRNGWYVQSVAM